MSRKQPPAWAPMLAFSSCTWLSAALVVSLSRTWGNTACIVTCAVAIVIAAGALIMLRRGVAGIVSLCVLGCCAGLMLSASATAMLHAQMGAAETMGECRMQLRVLEDSKEGDFGSSCIALATTDSGLRLRVRANLPEGTQADCWQTFQAEVAVKSPLEAAADYYWQHGCVGSVTVHDVELSDPSGVIGCIFRLRHAGIGVFEGLPEDFRSKNEAGIDLLQAILFGSRRGLFASEFYRDVKVVGLAHIVAVSGAHLVIVSGFLASVLAAMRIPKGICVPLQVVFVLAYVAFTGMPVSAMRAAIMSTCAFSSYIVRRRSASVSALGLCALGMIGLDPFMALSVSLALSCLASLGIVLLARPVTACLDHAFAGHARFVSRTLGATVAANALTIGVSAALFAQVPLVAPLSNLVAVPVFGLLVGAGLAVALFAIVFPGAATFPVMALVQAAQAFCQVVALMAKIPFACIAVDVGLPAAIAVTAALLVAYLVFIRSHAVRFPKRVVLGCLLAVVAIAVLAPRTHGCEVVMLDVGQGDAVLYRSGRKAVLVDTGTNDAQLLAGLARHDVRALDAIVISHPDDDHCGSLGAVADVMPVGCVCVAADLLDCRCENCSKLRAATQGMKVVPLEAGDHLAFGPFDIDVLAPMDFKEEGGNADSLVMSIRIDCDGDGACDWRAFTSGDAEADIVGGLTKSGGVASCDVLKVAHHGSAGGLDDELLDVLDPSIALIGVGEGNRYGHPAHETLELLERHGIAVYRTDEDGDIVCRFDARSCSVHTTGT